MSAHTYDVIVVGGGPAGSTAAAKLAGRGWSVRLVDRSRPDEFKVGESLVPAARVVLDEIGATAQVLDEGHLPYFGNRSSWGTPVLQDVDFIHSPHGHGWHLQRAKFDHSLRSHAASRGAILDVGTRVTAFERTGRTWKVHLESDEGARWARCRWLIDASGRRRRVARALGVGCRHADAQVAFAARFGSLRAEDDVDGTTLVEAARDGWWYTARLPGKARIAIFFTDVRDDARRSARRMLGFQQLLAETQFVGEWLARHDWRPKGRPSAWDARTSCLDQFSGEGWLAAGDAALALDPLSSQGILTALYAGLKAAEAIEHLESGNPDAASYYRRKLLSVFDAFRSHRRIAYDQERRWPASPYWRRRHEELSESPAVARH